MSYILATPDHSLAMEAPFSPSSTITAPPDYHEAARRLARMIAEAMTCNFTLMHYDSALESMIKWCWPIGCDGKKIPPSHLEMHRDGYDFRFPCCLCADGGGRGVYVESAVYSWWDEGTKKTDWTTSRLLVPSKREQTELLNRLNSSIGDGIPAREFWVLFRRCKNACK
ncbi:uncharacterized protein EDB91DRAFT_1084759 [Suillus paluster]|uniref:uncharacterized protein n=1 Tax=Suillus paluster TaxID=48578 RepID=UPI001B86C1BB|nr:uncharacterized protein EDB91DRAFT_1084759 [Suillus paluster]KAG1732430.1 hypothetical protein EDB91DRAFT_1084759 [Suillus paluster]